MVLEAKLRELHRHLGVPVEYDGDGLGDRIDVAARDAARTLDGATRERLIIKTREVQAALDRIDAGVYGKCSECGEPIGAKRLQALPAVETCIACQSSRETQAPRDGGRPPIYDEDEC